MKREDNFKSSMEIRHEAEDRPFDFDSMPWLDEDEYYPHIDSLRSVFNQFNVILQARQFTPVSWVLWASKPISDRETGV
jgi:hypothetical protein